MHAIPNNIVRQVLILLSILILGYILFDQLSGFLPALLGAYTLYILLRRAMIVLTERYKWKKALAASLLMLLSFIVILVPIFFLVNMMSSKIGFAISHSSEVLNSILHFIHQYESRFNFTLLTDENIKKITEWFGRTLPGILGATFNTVASIGILYLILYFMLTGGKSMESKFREWMPLKSENIAILDKELNSLVFSNAVGIPVVALLQGITGLIIYIILGVREPFFWFAITSITAMLPILGAALAYIPLALLFFANNEAVKGILMLALGFGVIGTVDNFFRFWLQKKIGDVHPLITVFGAIIGVSLFGFIGLIFGPILISLFLLLIRIYINEFSVSRSA